MQKKHRHRRIRILGEVVFAGHGDSVVTMCEDEKCGAVQTASVNPAAFGWSRWTRPTVRLVRKGKKKR